MRQLGLEELDEGHSLYSDVFSYIGLTLILHS